MRHIRLHATQPAAQDIACAAKTIRSGGLVAFPTETVYGLGAKAWDPSAIDKIFRAKGRPPTTRSLCISPPLTNCQRSRGKYLFSPGSWSRQFWPGALTLVLKKSARIPANLAAGLDTVAVRLPDHPVAAALLMAAQVPIAAPSANRFSRPSPTTAQHVLDDLAGAVDVLLDAGPATIGVESTIISLVDERTRLLRPGGVSLEALREYLPQLEFAPRYLGADQTSPAPGSLLKHYSPRARLVVFQGGDDAALRGAIRAEMTRNQSVGVMASDADVAAFAPLNVKIERLGNDDEAVAKRLFAAMRALDARGVDVIIARAPQKRGLGLAIWDRLLRAAEGALVKL